ncbi:MAG: aminotransferase class III-fold pyridoxal phosphate-dependent enzyme [Pirellulaceae bacterium]
MRRVNTSDSQGLLAVGHYRPHLHELLHTMGLDVDYHRAEGEWVYYFDERHREVQVLDLVGGYGSLLLGHGHPELIAEALRFFTSGQCNRVQGSVNRLATRVAAVLSDRIERDICVVLASSGAEAVEAAMKHAMLETGGQTFFTLEGAFHGKTLAAQQLASRPLGHHLVAPDGLEVIQVRPDDLEQLEWAFARIRRPAGFIFEPIQGEGGIRCVSAEFLRRAADLCAAHQIPLIADECQTGLGRTGSFLASQELGLRPDYIILSKALGGGLAKISAVLIDRQRYQPEFDLLHSSTFGDDQFCCAIALKTLALLDDALLATCRAKGQWLKHQLQILMQKYPTVIADVRGKGLMLGVELCRPALPNDFLLRFLVAGDLLGMVVAGHLLKSHQVRIASTLSDPFTLRIQPSALAGYESLQRCVVAWEATCARLQERDIAGLTSFLLEGRVAGGRFPTIWPSKSKSVDFRPSQRLDDTSRPALPRVAWLFHLADADDLPHLEPALGHLSRADRDTYLERLAPFAKPVVMDRVEIRSPTGQRVHLHPILLPVTSRWLKNRFDQRRMGELRSLVQCGVDVAASLGCQCVALGQFTSIVTRRGRNIFARGMGITSGNNFTAAIAVNEIRAAQAQAGIMPSDTVLAIVGATGDIGRVCAEILAPDYQKTLLVGSGRASSKNRLIHLARQLDAEWSTDLSTVVNYGVVMCAVNSVDSPLTAEHLAPGAIVCDVSVPDTLSPATALRRPDVKLIRGGIVRLPLVEDLGIPGLPLPRGYVYGCLAESLLAGFEGLRNDVFAGPSSTRKVRQMETIGRRHAFLPPDSPRTVPLPPDPRTVSHVPADS